MDSESQVLDCLLKYDLLRIGKALFCIASNKEDASIDTLKTKWSQVARVNTQFSKPSCLQRIEYTGDIFLLYFPILLEDQFEQTLPER